MSAGRREYDTGESAYVFLWHGLVRADRAKNGGGSPRETPRCRPPPRPPRDLGDELGDGAWACPHIPVRVWRWAGLPFRPPPSLRTRIVIVFPLPRILRVNDPVERGGIIHLQSGHK